MNSYYDKVKVTNGINTDADKQEKAVFNRLLEEIFDEADEWLVAGNPPISPTALTRWSGPA